MGFESAVTTVTVLFHRTVCLSAKEVILRIINCCFLQWVLHDNLEQLACKFAVNLVINQSFFPESFGKPTSALDFNDPLQMQTNLRQFETE